MKPAGERRRSYAGTLIRMGLALAGVLALLVGDSAPASAQVDASARDAPTPARVPPIETADSVTVVAGDEYGAGWLHGLLLGDGYRAAWTEPVTVPVLRLSEYAGGLEATERGGGVQTSSLRLVGPEGREYSFRSVNKSYTEAMPEWARGTVLEWLRADQTAAQHPGAVLVATPMLNAAGVPNPGPRLVVLADDPGLDEFRDEFAGMLGTVEIHANEGPDDEPFWYGSETIAGGDRVLEHLAEEPEHRVDGAAWLAERLMSIYLNDWDRHIGQYRFARYERADGGYRWVPVPEDRDYAFVHHNGLLLQIARAGLSARLVRFRTDYPDVTAMLSNSQDLARELLAPVDRPLWDSVTAAVHARLTDEAIERAVRSLPESWEALDAAELAETLRGRREGFVEMSDRFYELMARYPEVRATDEDELAEIERHPGGDVTVRIRAPGNDVLGDRPYYERRFDPDQTREVRLDLREGDDRAVIRGEPGSVLIRLVGGEGDDVLIDSVGGAVLYDAEGDNRLVAGPDTRVDRRPFEPPEEEFSLLPNTPRDWGTTRAWFSPAVDWAPDVGPLVGGGPRWTRYGFRHVPFESRHRLAAVTALVAWRGAAAYRGEFRPENSLASLELEAGASNVDVIRYHGFGNQSPRVPDDSAVSWVRRYAASATWRMPRPGGLEVALGPMVRWSEPELEAGSPLRAQLPYGARGLGEAGLTAGAAWDTRNDETFPRRGVRAGVQAGGFLPFEEAPTPFGVTDGKAVGFLSIPGVPVIAAVRAGGRAAVGDVPVYLTPAIGGRDDLRGYSEDRFRGDAAVFGTAELRVPLVPAKFIARGIVGVSGFTDAGRVWLDGDSPGGWHTALGGSVWFTTPLGSVAAEYATGEKNTVYVRVGLGL